jgi:DNA-binding NarL/FixJ family response regulator
MLTVYSDYERIFQAMCAGACGYLLKQSPPARLLDSVRAAVRMGAPLSPEVARKVVKLLAEGHYYKTAAAEIQVSINTVSYHMRSIYQKLRGHSKSQAVAKALRDPLIR